MKKTQLDIDQLAVESFATARDEAVERGTVDAHSGVPLGGCVSLDECVINPTFGTGEMYCICVAMVNPTDSSGDAC